VVMRLVGADTQKVYSTIVWSSGYYGNVWDYYGNGWTTVTPIGKGRDATSITVETLLYDIASGKRVKTIDTTKWGTRPRGIKRSPDGKHYVATLEHGNSFIVMDGNYKVLKSVATGESPYGVAFDRAGERLFVAASRAKLLQVFDTKDWNKVAEVPIGARCWHFTFTPDDRQILVACGRSDDVVVVDAQTLQPTKKTPAGKMPWGIVTYPKSIGSLDAP